jgi:adenylate cyclase
VTGRSGVEQLRQFFFPAKAVVHPLPYVLIAALGVAFGLGLGALSLSQRLEWALYDRMMQTATRVARPPSDIVVVAIDELSFSEIGLQWPWPRRLHAQLIDVLVRGGARTIAFDLLFDVPSTTADDEALARAVRSAGNVVLASDRAEVSDRAYTVQQWREPIPVLGEAAAAVGAVGIDIDPDGVLRRTAATIDGRPALALAVARRQPHAAAPWDGDRPRLIHFCGASRQGIVTVSYYQAIEPGLLPAGLFRDKAVLVGRSLSAAAALDAPDHFRTPVALRMAGAEVQANLLDTLLRRRAIADPFGEYGALVLWSIAIATVAALTFYRLGPPAGVATLIASALVFTAAVYVALSAYNVRVPVVGPLLAVAGVYVSTTTYRFALGQRERRLIRRAFQHYVAPAIVQQMLDDPSRLKLGGEECEVSVLFTDLEGFTSVAERLKPEELQRRLSTYFKAMMDVLLAERATLDKFIGDAIMVYFGCPIRDAAHPVQACRAALAMQRRLAELNDEWRGTQAPELRMRIGVNTGVAVAGNMGTDTIFNYTIIGDCVNLASRLEGVNKEYGTWTIVGAETWARVNAQFEARELDWIRVKGKAQPIAIYELMAAAGELSDVRRTLVARFADGLALYRAKRWDEAAEAFRRALAVDGLDRPSKVFLNRCTYYADDHPPPADWDGVHIMTTK